MTKKDGSDLTTKDNVAPVNMTLHSMFSQVDVSLQQQPVSEVGPNHAYKAYFDVLLNTKSVEEMTCMLFYEDTPMHFDDTDALSGSNGGLTNRFHYTNLSRTTDLIGRLQTDICQQDRLLLNGVPINVKLWPSTDAFRLMAADKTEGYKLNIVDAALKVCTVKVHPGVLLGHAEAIQKSPALYPFMRSKVKRFAVAKGQFSFTDDKPIPGRCTRSDDCGTGIVRSC